MGRAGRGPAGVRPGGTCGFSGLFPGWRLGAPAGQGARRGVRQCLLGDTALPAFLEGSRRLWMEETGRKSASEPPGVGAGGAASPHEHGSGPLLRLAFASVSMGSGVLEGVGASLGSCRNPDIGLVPLGPHRPPPSRGCRDVPALPGGNGHVAESPQPRGPLARLPPAARGRLRVFTPSRRTDRSTLGAASCLQSAVRIKLMTKASRSPEALQGSRTRFTEARITPASSESTLCPWPENGARTRRKTRETVDRPAIWAACPAGRTAPWCWAPASPRPSFGDSFCLFTQTAAPSHAPGTAHPQRGPGAAQPVDPSPAGLRGLQPFPRSRTCPCGRTRRPRPACRTLGPMGARRLDEAGAWRPRAAATRDLPGHSDWCANMTEVRCSRGKAFRGTGHGPFRRIRGRLDEGAVERRECPDGVWPSRAGPCARRGAAETVRLRTPTSRSVSGGGRAAEPCLAPSRRLGHTVVPASEDADRPGGAGDGRRGAHGSSVGPRDPGSCLRAVRLIQA